MKYLRYGIWMVLVALLLGACGRGHKKDDQPPAANNDAQSRLNVGQPAPDFTLPTSDGGTVSLADYRRKQPVLLFFHMAKG
jgi:cytochrome oxidase Cu insertion factor (SCO1/SenC/PrrC family)